MWILVNPCHLVISIVNTGLAKIPGWTILSFAKSARVDYCAVKRVFDENKKVQKTAA